MVQNTYTIEAENLDELMQKMQRLQMKNPKMDKQLKTLMRESLRYAVKEMKKAAKDALPNDPRKAYNAVRSSVYKKILGGQVNILQRKKNNGRMYVGGSHSSSRERSERTQNLQGYYGTDRGFILRFLNAGTEDRVARTMNAHGIIRTERPRRKGGYKSGVIGFRGSIAPKNWFAPAAGKTMHETAEMFCELVDRAIAEVWNEN